MKFYSNVMNTTIKYTVNISLNSIFIPQNDSSIPSSFSQNFNTPTPRHLDVYLALFLFMVKKIAILLKCPIFLRANVQILHLHLFSLLFPFKVEEVSLQLPKVNCSTCPVGNATSHLSNISLLQLFRLSPASSIFSYRVNYSY